MLFIISISNSEIFTITGILVTAGKNENFETCYFMTYKVEKYFPSKNFSWSNLICYEFKFINLILFN